MLHEIKGQESIRSICKCCIATEYLNVPGVVKLYDQHEFEEHNIKLRVLDEYRGTRKSILERLVKEDNRSVTREMQG